MNEKQYEQFNTEDVQRNTVCLDDLADKTPRTLLFGYDVTRATFHVYIDPADGLIHVLKYTSTGPANAQKFLVISHTSGQSGGVARNEQFVPDKRLYPESCDLEFSRLLRRYGVSLPFTTFDAAGLARVERFNGFAGYVATADTPKGVMVASLIGGRPADYGDVRLLRQLIHEACIETNAQYAVLDETVWAAEQDVGKVVEQVRAYRETMGQAAFMDPCELEEAIVGDAILFGHYAMGHSSYPDRFGSYTFSLNYIDGARLADDVVGAVRYVGAEGVTALQAMYEGRPYLVVLEKGTKSHAHVNLFGSADKFIHEMVKRHGLTKVAIA
jgi:hypothetical protein